MCVAAFAMILRRNDPVLRRGVAKFILLAAAAPMLWLAYNAIIYRNPLEFANGPYSARAIEQKNATPGSPAHPGSHDLPVAFSYFLKSAELNMAEANLQKLWVALLLAGTIGILLRNRRLWPLLLLWVPIPFYMLSIAYSGVPIFLPDLVAVFVLQRALWAPASSLVFRLSRGDGLFAAGRRSKQNREDGDFLHGRNPACGELCICLASPVGLLPRSLGKLANPHRFRN